METFVYERIDIIQFDREFCQMWRVDRDKNSKLLKRSEDLKN